jgi:HSP20 family protein
LSRREARLPASALALLQQEMSQLFHRLATLEQSEALPASEWCPAVDVFESRDTLVVVIEAPGLAPDALQVAFRDRSLVVSGARRARRAPAGASYLCLERPHGRFERTIPLQGAVDVARARATLGAGLLTVTVPRLRERRGQQTVVPVEREPAR